MGSFKKKFFVICMDPGYGQCFEMDSMGYKETLDTDCTLKLNVVSKVNCIKLYHTIHDFFLKSMFISFKIVKTGPINKYWYLIKSALLTGDNIRTIFF